MPNLERRKERGRANTMRQLRSLGEEVRNARMTASLSQVDLAAAVAISHSQLGRLERAELPNARLLVFGSLFAVLGMRLSIRAYPDGPPIRDVAHARLIGRLKAQLPKGVRLRTEVPLVNVEVGDQRAWDGELGARDWTRKFEAETRLHDIQASDRRIALKKADDDVDRVILLVANTRHNRAVLREFRPLLADRYPLTGRHVLAALRAGRCPETSGIVIF